jgi:hypothetical protein
MDNLKNDLIKELEKLEKEVIKWKQKIIELDITSIDVNTNIDFKRQLCYVDEKTVAIYSYNRKMKEKKTIYLKFQFLVPYKTDSPYDLYNTSK